MTWLAEILSDESIPEEDRYWLDCRMRAVIAQDLHLFYNEKGSPIQIEADFICPGEDYWREHMMVNPLGSTDVADEYRPTRAFGDPGYILDLFGNRFGDLAEVNPTISLSRDASISVVVSGGTTLEHLRDPYACFMYPDGSFKEAPFDTRGNEVYQDDELVYNVTAEGRYNEETIVSPNGYFLLTREDHMIMNTTSLPTVIRQISREVSE